MNLIQNIWAKIQDILRSVDQTPPVIDAKKARKAPAKKKTPAAKKAPAKKSTPVKKKATKKK